MLFRVAAQSGRWDVDALAREMPADLFDEWCAFYSLEPWGWQADAWRMGVIAATTANYSGRVKKALKPSDFMPGDKPRKRTISEAETRAMLERDVKAAKHGE